MNQGRRFRFPQEKYKRFLESVRLSVCRCYHRPGTGRAVLAEWRHPLWLFLGFILPFGVMYAHLVHHRSVEAVGPPFSESHPVRLAYGQSRSFTPLPSDSGPSNAASNRKPHNLAGIRHATSMTIRKMPTARARAHSRPGPSLPAALTMPETRLRLPDRGMKKLDIAWNRQTGGPPPDRERAPRMDPPEKINPARLVGVQLASAIAGYRIFQKYNQFFGGVAQPFKIGSDWTKDNAIYSDELLHFQGSYRLTQAITELYRWAGVSQNRAEWLGATIAATAMTFLEYIDGRRANDEASYSDLTANFLGVTFALLKPRVPLFRYIDFHVSYRGLTDPLQKQKLLNYDRITHWLAVEMEPLTGLPFHAAVGYGVSHTFQKNAHPKLLLGFGIGLGQLLKNHLIRLPGPFQWLDVYQIGVQFQVM